MERLRDGHASRRSIGQRVGAHVRQRASGEIQAERGAYGQCCNSIERG
jgi:hypothetical protein